MRVALISGIFPPDIGGPATHSSELAEELRRRGHTVRVVTLADGASSDKKAHVVRYPRSWPWPLRLAAVSWWLVWNRRDYDVVYATGLEVAAVAGAAVARRPAIVKVVGDAAWERARRLGLSNAEFDDFQRERLRGLRVRAMCGVRNWALRNATAITTPSNFLADVVLQWLGDRTHVYMIPNGVRLKSRLESDDVTKSGSLKALFVGRIVAHKCLPTLVEAVARTSRVEFSVIGDGPELSALKRMAQNLNIRGRVRFLGMRPHDEVLTHIAAADVLVLASGYEGLPHVVLEALASGTVVASAPVGGVPEVVENGVNGVLVDPPNARSFAAVLTQLRDDPHLRSRLSREAGRVGNSWRFEHCVDALEALLSETLSRGSEGTRAKAGNRARSRAFDWPARPRAVFLGKGGLDGMAAVGFRRRLTILEQYLDLTVIGVGRPVVQRLQTARLIGLPALRLRSLSAVIFYALGPVIATFVASSGRPSAIVCKSPYEGFGTLLLARILPSSLRAPVVVEVHGDWSTATRMYGSRARRLISPLANWTAVWALRRADRVRVVSDYALHLIREVGYEGEVDRYPAFIDLNNFLEEPLRPLPLQPRVAFIGSLEPTKGVDVLLEAWSSVLAEIPHAHLTIAGGGSISKSLRRQSAALDLDGRIEFAGSVSREEVRDILDASSLIVLPSRSEGWGRVIVEAFARGRPAVATRSGGVVEIIREGRTGILVPTDDPRSLANEIVGLLRDPRRLESFGREARRQSLQDDPVAQFDLGTKRLATWIRTGNSRVSVTNSQGDAD